MTEDRPAAMWIGDPDPNCPECEGFGWVAMVYEAWTNTWQAEECPCTYRHTAPSW